jgi:hypothetical protein
VRWWTVRAVIGAAFALVPQVVALGVLGADAPGWLTATTAATAVLGLAYVLVMPRWRYRVHRWEATGHAVYTLEGWLRLEWRVAPISRIQTIDTERSPLQRLFGLATVTVTTASASGPVRIEGLAAEPAADLAHRLTEAAEADRGDAT